MRSDVLAMLLTVLIGGAYFACVVTFLRSIRNERLKTVYRLGWVHGRWGWKPDPRYSGAWRPDEEELGTEEDDAP